MEVAAAAVGAHLARRAVRRPTERVVMQLARAAHRPTGKGHLGPGWAGRACSESRDRGEAAGGASGATRRGAER